MKYNADNQDSSLYQKWNHTTATCFYYKMICKNCPNQDVCMLGNASNQYHIKQTKYSVLMTFANVGKKGLKRYLLEERENANDE